MTIADAEKALSEVLRFAAWARCRIFGHRFEPYTTVHLGDRFRQSFICAKCKNVRNESRKTDKGKHVH